MDENTRELMILYALDELDAEERAYAEARIRQNPELEKEVERFRQADDLLARTAQDTPPLPTLMTKKRRKSLAYRLIRDVVAVGVVVGVLGMFLLPATKYARESAKMVFSQREFDMALCEAPCEALVCEERAVPNDPNGYTPSRENTFQSPKTAPFSTFGVDVDTASYTLMRSYLEQYPQLPPPESVRVEEYVNYFDYDLPQPGKEDACPFTSSVEVGKHPWIPGLYMAKIGLQGRKIDFAELPPLNLVFLIDVSGSMDTLNKLPLVQEALTGLVEQLRPQDRVALVTYCGDVQVRLNPTPGTLKGRILGKIRELRADGSTNGSGGIDVAYELARKNFDSEAINRVVLCSDGDFNVGTYDIAQLEQSIEKYAKTGTFLTVLGFGMGNYKDNRMESLADHGNGSFAYIDTAGEARRVLGTELAGTMAVIAKDVKIQIEFNPALVSEYRLIGYENRVLRAEDFHDDRKDAGEIGAGHRVVALYEIVPVGVENPLKTPPADAPRYAATSETPETSDFSNELFFVKLRWKKPDSDTSDYRDFPVAAPELKPASPDFRFAAGVALFAEILRQSEYTNGASFATVEDLISGSDSKDEKRAEFRDLVKKAREIKP